MISHTQMSLKTYPYRSQDTGEGGWVAAVGRKVEKDGGREVIGAGEGEKELDGKGVEVEGGGEFCEVLGS